MTGVLRALRYTVVYLDAARQQAMLPLSLSCWLDSWRPVSCR